MNRTAFLEAAKVESQGFCCCPDVGSLIAIPPSFAMCEIALGSTSTHGLRWSLLGTAAMARQSRTHVEREVQDACGVFWEPAWPLLLKQLDEFLDSTEDILVDP